MDFRIYCDGSTKGNGKENSVGAWAWLVQAGGIIIHQDCQAEKDTTNQRMELTAAAQALDYVYRNLVCEHDRIVVYTDSAYLHNCYQQKWYVNWQKNGWKNTKKQPVANQDLWERLIPYFDTFGIDFVKVKGHAGGRNEHERYNDIVDDLAQTAAAHLQGVVYNEDSRN